MRTKLPLFILLSFSFCLLSSQVPQGFNYQAIARSSNGKEIVSTALQVKISVLTDTTNFYISGSGTYLWEEQQNVTTNSFGLFSLIVGNPAATKVQGSASNFSSINWNSGPLYLGAKIYYQGVWLNMGTSKFGSVPYAKVANTVAGPIQKLSVKGTATSPDTALFEVKNINGQTVFAVYNEGIRAYVDNGIVKGATKGGFAIGGFETAKATSQPFMMITPDSARIYVNETAVKGTKGGFAIGGFNTAKGTTTEFMKMTPSNYFIGHKSGQSITTGIYNSTMGYESGKSLTTGTNNVMIGYQSGTAVTGGASNVFIGSQAGFTDGTGGYNVFIGTQAGYSNSSGLYNIALGRQSGYSTTTGYRNIFIGDQAGNYNSTGDLNVMVGDWAGRFSTIGDRNIFLGAEAGYNNSEGYDNIFLGYRAGYNNDLGYDNIAIGNQAGRKTEGNWNTMLGYLAGDSTVTGGSQVLLGYQAGRANTSGWNTMVGSLAGGQSGTGTYNTYLGLAAGEQATGDFNVFIGRWAGRFEGINNNKLVIETRYEGTDNSNNALIYGDFLAKTLRINGDLSSVDIIASNDNPAVLGQHNVTANWGIGVKGVGGYIGVRGESTLTGGVGTRVGVYGAASGGATNYAGYFSGNVYATGTITQLSDKNYKKNIIPLAGSLMKIIDLQGVTYEWKSDSELSTLNLNKGDGSKESESLSLNLPKGTQIGLIAQDVENVVPDIVQTNGAGLKSVDYIKIIPLLIESIKDQQRQIEELKALVLSLSSQIKK
jgi:trimeric autotransporter adhesin